VNSGGKGVLSSEARDACYRCKLCNRYGLGHAQVRGQLAVLEAACQQLQGSEAWVVLLQEILATGNRLNAGTHRGSAAGALIEPSSRCHNSDRA
jgi:Formin Homology 2 Domain